MALLPLHSHQLDTIIHESDFIHTTENLVSYLIVQSSTSSQFPISLKSTVVFQVGVRFLVCCQLPKTGFDQWGMIPPLDHNDSLPSCIISAYTIYQSEAREIYALLVNTSNTNIEL